MKDLQFALLIIICLIVVIKSYPSCSVVEFSEYSFDLSSLKNVTVSIKNDDQYAKYYPCYPDACSEQPNAQKSFLIKGLSSKCQTYSINTTIFPNYDYIDSNQPKLGIKVSYLPYIKQTIGDNSSSLTTFRAIVNLYCPDNANVREQCIQTRSNSTDAIWFNETKILTCNIMSSSGCPYITKNNFWQFLQKNRIWFAVVLWIFSLFQLFMGYFVIRLTLFLYGILTGAVFGIFFTAQNYENSFYDDTGDGIKIFVILLSFFTGILFGISLLTLPRIGYINIGFWNALIFSLLLQNSVLYLTETLTGFYITLGISGVIMLAVSLLRFRKFIILSTGFISAFWLVRTLGFVLPYYPNEFTSSKLITINTSTPWQFYLYLASIIILSILGCAFQFCWYKRKGRDHDNKGYYLQDDDNIKDKLKKFLQFNDIKDLINAGKEEMMFLKNIVVENDSQSEDSHEVKKKKPRQIEMTNLQYDMKRETSKNKITKSVIVSKQANKKRQSSDSDSKEVIPKSRAHNISKNQKNSKISSKKDTQPRQKSYSQSQSEQEQVKVVKSKGRKGK